MGSLKGITGLIAGGLMMASGMAQAAEIDMLVNTLAEKGLITYGEAQQLITESKQEQRAAIARGEHDYLPLWLQTFTLKGDIRLRSQTDWSTAANKYDRTRERLRFRLGMETTPRENLKVGFGLATGSEEASTTQGAVGTTATGEVYDKEPTSTNHTFLGFRKPVIMLDYAFIQYTPLSSVTLTGGKMKSGTEAWNPTDIIWDTDVNPDGLAVNYNSSFNGVEVFANGSYLVLNEKGDSGNYALPDAYIFQPGAKVNLTDNIYAKAAVALQQFNVAGRNIGYFGAPAFDYKILNTSFDLGWNEIVGPYSFSVFGDLLTNTTDKATGNVAIPNRNGYCLGASFGHAKVAGFGQWQVKYLSRYLEANSTINKLTDSDSYGGDVSTAGQNGWEGIVTVGLTKDLSLGFDYYMMDRINGSTDMTAKSLIQTDLVYKF